MPPPQSEDRQDAIRRFARFYRQQDFDRRVRELAERLVGDEDLNRTVRHEDGREGRPLDQGLAEAIARVFLTNYAGTAMEYRTRLLAGITDGQHGIVVEHKGAERVAGAIEELAWAIREELPDAAAVLVKRLVRFAREALRAAVPDEDDVPKNRKQGFADRVADLLERERPSMADFDRLRLAVRIGELLGTEPAPRDRSGAAISDAFRAQNTGVERMRRRRRRRKKSSPIP